MHLVAIGLGALCCAGGACAHFSSTREREGLFGLAAFAFLLAGMFLTRA